VIVFTGFTLQPMLRIVVASTHPMRSAVPVFRIALVGGYAKGHGGQGGEQGPDVPNSEGEGRHRKLLSSKIISCRRRVPWPHLGRASGAATHETLLTTFGDHTFVP
jgi:hypothetical protein